MKHQGLSIYVGHKSLWKSVKTYGSSSPQSFLSACAHSAYSIPLFHILGKNVVPNYDHKRKMKFSLMYQFKSRHPFFWRRFFFLLKNSKSLFGAKQFKFSITCQQFKNKDFSVYKKYVNNFSTTQFFKTATFSCIECSDNSSLKIASMDPLQVKTNNPLCY